MVGKKRTPETAARLSKSYEEERSLNTLAYGKATFTREKPRRFHMTLATNSQSLRQRFNPDGSLLRRQQMRMMELLLALDAICRRHNIKYWLIGGTLLGAARHKGFIPWDDDMDVQMFRDDYLRLLNILQQELPATMAIQCRQTDRNYFFQYAKLRDRRSLLDESTGYDRVFKERGIYIDIFPIDRHPQWVQRLSMTAIGHSYKILKRTDLSDEQIMLRVNRLVHFCERVVFPVLRGIGKVFGGPYLDALGVPFVVPRHKEDILPLATLEFEGHSMPVPGNYDKVLRDQYGDYMQLPDLSTIHPHAVKLKIK